jgi:hypothetical protein
MNSNNFAAPSPLRQNPSAKSVLELDAQPPHATPFASPITLSCIMIALIREHLPLEFMSTLASQMVRERWNLGLEKGLFNLWPIISYNVTPVTSKESHETIDELLNAFSPESVTKVCFKRLDAETLYAAVTFAETENALGLCVCLLDGERWLFHDLIAVDPTNFANAGWFESEQAADDVFNKQSSLELGESVSSRVSVPFPEESHVPTASLYRASPDAEYWDSYGLTLKQETMARQAPARSKEVGWENSEADDNEEDDYWNSYI